MIHGVQCSRSLRGRRKPPKGKFLPRRSEETQPQLARSYVGIGRRGVAAAAAPPPNSINLPRGENNNIAN